VGSTDGRTVFKGSVLAKKKKKVSSLTSGRKKVNFPFQKGIKGVQWKDLVLKFGGEGGNAWREENDSPGSASASHATLPCSEKTLSRKEEGRPHELQDELRGTGTRPHGKEGGTGVDRGDVETKVGQK